ncbi:CDP-glycerol glycerophosphotransferase family protein [Actinomyces sp. 565]|uniref:bifunctional glycosyltransferase/CDP-glycerol:glycerophosphate glycerophosphotransferase n=1 Tax=Actinomyces sp. 565 TaxID=2057794 RepID=UPI0013A6EEDF|nr:CDP-glycerol glycerophosphotransferase family protein [Actinomyces sp. 565]NDR52812.1 glycosyl transferase [Actinomyces sp. 565]
MGIQSTLRLLARRRRPVLSVVLLVGANASVARAARSLLNQQSVDGEVLALVMDSCPPPEREALGALARRNRRVRVIEGGLGTVLEAARGRMLTIMSASDAAARDGYGTIPADGEVHLGGARPLAQGPGPGVPEPRRLTSITSAPELLDGFIPGRVVAPASAWVTAAAGIGDAAPQEAARTAALRLVLGAQPVLVEPADLVLVGAVPKPGWDADLSAVASAIAADRRLLAGGGEALLGVLHGRALVDLAAGAPAQPDDAVERLRAVTRSALPDADTVAWGALPFSDRLLLWVLGHAGSADLLEVLASRYEDTPAVPLTAAAGGLRADPPVLERIAPVPAQVRAVTDADLRIHQVLRACRWIGEDGLLLEGWAYVPGVDPCADPGPEVVLIGVDGREVARADVERIAAPLADLEAEDPWRSYTGSGYRATVSLAGIPSAPMRVQLRLRVAGRLLEQPVPPPLGTRRPRTSATGWSAAADGGALVIRPSAAGEAPPGAGGLAPDGVSVARASLDGGRLRVGGPGPVPADLAITAAASSGRFPLTTTVAAGGWAAELDLADPSLPSGGFVLRWSAAGSEGRCVTGAALDGPPTELAGRVRRVRLRPQADGGLEMSIIAPVDPQYRSRYGRRLLIEEDWGPLVPGIFFETFSGKSAGDNPGAIRDELIARSTPVPLWVSVRDGTVSVPAGATPIVVGTPEWFRALRTARLLVVNDHLPHWFTKDPGQRLLQTWHGTPIKRLLNDAPPTSVTLPYRRLMARQAPQWDLLLAQSPAAAADLRHGLGYAGQVLVGEQPRNTGLLGGQAKAGRVRAQLGIGPAEPVILYAPTWREGLRRPHQDASELLDAGALARATGAVVLLRSHHMNSLRAHADRVIGVGRYPSVEDLMLASDLLITDYSSVIFDWALTGRPALLHLPDLEAYRDRERGFYRDWPADSGLPVTRTQAQVQARAAELLAAGPVPAVVDPAPIRASLDAVCAWIDTVLPGAVPTRPGEEEPHE